MCEMDEGVRPPSPSCAPDARGRAVDFIYIKKLMSWMFVEIDAFICINLSADFFFFYVKMRLLCATNKTLFATTLAKKVEVGALKNQIFES